MVVVLSPVLRPKRNKPPPIPPPTINAAPGVLLLLPPACRGRTSSPAATTTQRTKNLDPWLGRRRTIVVITGTNENASWNTSGTIALTSMSDRCILTTFKQGTTPTVQPFFANRGVLFRAIEDDGAPSLCTFTGRKAHCAHRFIHRYCFTTLRRFLVEYGQLFCVPSH